MKMPELLNDNPWLMASGYLSHRIHHKFKHPVFCKTKIVIFLKKSSFIQSGPDETPGSGKAFLSL